MCLIATWWPFEPPFLDTATFTRLLTRDLFYLGSGDPRLSVQNEGMAEWYVERAPVNTIIWVGKFGGGAQRKPRLALVELFFSFRNCLKENGNLAVLRSSQMRRDSERFLLNFLESSCSYFSQQVLCYCWIINRNHTIIDTFSATMNHSCSNSISTSRLHVSNEALDRDIARVYKYFQIIMII